METRWKRPSLWRFSLFFIRSFLLSASIGMIFLLALIYYAYSLGAPDVEQAHTTKMYDADNNAILETHQGKRRYWVDKEDIQEDYLTAVKAVEDRNFYNHAGFDVPRIAAAAMINLQEMRLAQGASTITQQYARNLFLSHDKTWMRKLEEALYTLRLEWHTDKEAILEGYVNTIYFGHGAYGIEAAANLYFDKPASDLSMAEAAMLAAIPKGPSYYSPHVDKERAQDRQQLILQLMEDQGRITTEERLEAENTPLDIQPLDEVDADLSAPYFSDYALKELQEKHELDEEMLTQESLHIQTTVEPDLQQAAETAVNDHLPNESDLQAALVALEPRTGEIKALVGGKNYKESAFNRAADAKRAPGSTFKPFLYYAALEQGFTPATSFVSEPTTFSYDEGEQEYKPGNFADVYANDFITLLQALAFSDNIFAVKTHLYLGPDQLVKTANAAGITSELRPNPSLALGTSEVGILELTKAYAPFANGGFAIEPMAVTEVTDAKDEIIVEGERSPSSVFDPRLTSVMTDLLSSIFEPELNDYTAVTGSSIAHKLDDPIAGKSGSTQHDSWMVGYTPALVVGVWVGHDEKESFNHAEDGNIAKEIWGDVMAFHQTETEHEMSFEENDQTVYVDIDPSTGLLADDACGPSRTTLFIEGSEPTTSCATQLDDDDSGEAEKDQEKEEELPEKKEQFFDRLKDWLGLS
ncbi:transglycosylase domain-containing protein [Salsuginibacillus kocurii]|uniref:transglycosylase domain-containing protein n=1 Tax=Salsuginibacillus kocurii TaxID=427078 RepID=UPI0003A75EB6|nr:PBP1A family penicillin-binding protein [Salsuginibacillus kocurii]